MLISPYLSCETREIREMQEQILGLGLGLHRTTSRSSITSFAGSIRTKMAYKRFCKNLFQMGVTSEIIAQKEGDILNMLNQPQDTAISGGGNSSGNSAQLITVSYCYFFPEWFIRYTNVI